MSRFYLQVVAHNPHRHNSHAYIPKTPFLSLPQARFRNLIHRGFRISKKPIWNNPP